MPLTKSDVATERKKALAMQHSDWAQLIINDLQKVHSNIREAVQHLDVMVWGHAMIQPHRSFMFSEEKQKAAAPIGKKIFFAHSDLSGISIFEEAFYHGHRAAKELIMSTCTG